MLEHTYLVVCRARLFEVEIKFIWNWPSIKLWKFEKSFLLNSLHVPCFSLELEAVPTTSPSPRTGFSGLGPLAAKLPQCPFPSFCAHMAQQSNLLGRVVWLVPTLSFLPLCSGTRPSVSLPLSSSLSQECRDDINRHHSFPFNTRLKRAINRAPWSLVLTVLKYQF